MPRSFEKLAIWPSEGPDSWEAMKERELEQIGPGRGEQSLNYGQHPGDNDDQRAMEHWEQTGEKASLLGQPIHNCPACMGQGDYHVPSGEDMIEPPYQDYEPHIMGKKKDDEEDKDDEDGASVLDALESRTADASYPPEAQIPQHEVAQVYNPAAYEGQLEGMHPAAQRSYELATRGGANPQAAMQAAQQQQSEMMQRANEGQNTQGVIEPVIGVTGSADDVNRNPLADILDSYDSGFVPLSTVQRVAHLLD